MKNATASLFFAALWITNVSGATPSLVVNPLTDTRIQVSIGDQDFKPLQKALTSNPELNAGRPLAFTISNKTSQQVSALTIRWTWTDPSGKNRIYDQRTDSFFTRNGLITQANSKVLVMPGIIIPESDSGGFGISGLKPLDNTMKQFDGASVVNAAVDCIIFADGTMLGADQSQTVDGLTIRRQVAQQVSMALLEAVNQGKDIRQAMIEYLKKSQVNTTSRAESIWREQIAGAFRSEKFATKENAELVAQKLGSLPALPQIKR